MSYDVFLEPPDGGEVWWRNHTSNTSTMWRQAGADLAAMDGRGAGGCAAVVRQAAERIAAEPERYRPMEPDNKWGTVETTVAFLDAIADACDEYPDTTLRVCR